MSSDPEQDQPSLIDGEAVSHQILSTQIPAAADRSLAGTGGTLLCRGEGAVRPAAARSRRYT